MNRWLISVLAALCLLQGAFCDVYMHNPSGSNNRLNDDGENARNQDRLFDSQNNAKGGYNVGVGDSKSTTYTGSGDLVSGAMRYYENTTLHIEWTNQHACGDFVEGEQNSERWGSKIRECEIVLQFMCETAGGQDEKFWLTRNLRNGFTEDTPPEDKDDPLTGQHESRDYYAHCKRRRRNQGIFTADRRLQGNTAIYTRQNNNGNRRGYECPEERDYYPYWHPTPWMDIAILTNNPKRCPYYQRESQNVRAKHYCTTREPNTPDLCSSTEGLTEHAYTLFNLRAQYSNYIAWYLVMMVKLEIEGSSDSKSFNDNAEKQMEQIVTGGDSDGLKLINSKIASVSQIGERSNWKKVDPWVKSFPAVGKPVCQTNKWTRSNHNGNARDMKGPYHYGFDWVIPKGIAQQDKPAKCVIRLRYNMSSSDYDNWNTFSWGNFDKKVIENNPRVVDPVATLQLTINTNQVGRTFQDRSHAFFIHSRKDLYDKLYNKYGTEYPETRAINDQTVIHNLNVRGKRGNIVQTYPAVEYDFTPNVLNIKKGDFVHFQWTGSNNNPKNYAGQGTAGTDRSNVMQMQSLTDNIPFPMNETTMWGDMNSQNWQERENARKLYYLFALLGQHDPLLNDADPYFNFPPIQFNSTGVYHYLCSRNNNFSNRSQKGTIVVADK